MAELETKHMPQSHLKLVGEGCKKVTNPPRMHFQMQTICWNIKNWPVDYHFYKTPDKPHTYPLLQQYKRIIIPFVPRDRLMTYSKNGVLCYTCIYKFGERAFKFMIHLMKTAITKLQHCILDRRKDADSWKQWKNRKKTWREISLLSASILLSLL